MPSPREQAQNAISEYLTFEPYWDAPYGVISSLKTLPRGGAVRNITFGRARYLDAQVTVWSVDRIEIAGEGALAFRVEGRFESADEAIEHLRSAVPETP